MGAPRDGLVILGAGGHGRVVASAARAAGWTSISFLDPRFPDLTRAGGWPVEGTDDDLAIIGGRSAIVAVGANASRLALLERLESAGVAIAAIVHPTAWICPGVTPGAGCFVGAQAAVNHGARIGRAAIVNTGAVVEHDCTVGDGAHVAVGAMLAGGVSVGRCAFVGTGASVIPGISVGEGATVGAGAAVVRDVPAGQTHVGVPARPVRR